MSLTRVPVNAIKKLIINVKKNRARKNWVKKIERAYQHIDPGANPIPLNIEAHIEKWQQLSPKVNPLWYKTYSYLSGKEDIDYVPEDIYYLLIEPKLNRHDVTPAYRDKNMYDKYNDKHPGIFPHVILRNIGGVYCDHDYNYIGDVAVFLAAI
ncbi:MAG: hypothetical protein GY757_02760, partial [bacterium]|nr:hypothetical protein [bacterium]